jgi:hypothetical protein
MTIHEPATLLTDFLLALLAGWLAWRLGATTTTRAGRWFHRMLWLTAASALIGGSYHGFARNFSPLVIRSWWLATLLTISLLGAALAMSLLHEFLPPARQPVWRGLIAVKLAGFAAAIFYYHVFVVAIADYGLVLLAWAVAALAGRRAWRGWMLGAIVLSALAAAVQQLKLAPSVHFNHNDLYHVIQALALLGFHQAGRRLAGPPAPVSRAGP